MEEIVHDISEELMKESTSDVKDIHAYAQKNDPSSQCILRLLNDQIRIVKAERVKASISSNDFIGFNVDIIDPTKGTYKFKLNSFSKQGQQSAKKGRKLRHHTLWITLTQNELEDLKVNLLIMAANKKIKRSDHRLKFLIFLNPNAGANSGRHFDAVVSFLRHTNFTFDLIETTHRGHCKQELDKLDVSLYEAVVIISGDGLMHEFVNSKACGRIPVTHVPGGSGNAFAKAQTTLAGQACRDEQAIFLTIKGRVGSMNLVKMELEKQPEPIYSFLALEWAFLADIDMNSEFLRCCGGFRFEVYAAYRCLALRRYPGRLTFSYTQTSLPPLSSEIQHPSFQSIQTTFLNSIFLSIPFISDKYQWGPLLKVEDEAIDMQYTTEQHGRWQLIKYLLNSDNGDHFDKEKQTRKEGFEFAHGKLKSYRLEPLGEGNNRGLFGIDGERYEAQRMQASISDRKILTFI